MGRLTGSPYVNSEVSRMQRRFTEDEEKAVCAYYVENRASTITTAEEFNTTKATIARVLKTHNVKLRPRGRPRRDKHNV